jgi:hypothetical protein
MRPWMIVLSSAIGAIVVTTALVGPDLLKASHSDFGSILSQRLSVLAVAALAVYALFTMLLTTGTLVADALFLRHRLGRTGPHRTSAQRDRMAAVGSTRLQRLVPGLIAEPARRAGASETSLLQSRFEPAAARGEIARLHYIWLARTHFFSALIVLSALIGLGLAQDHGAVPLMLGAIPTIATSLILVGLILLAILGRIAIDVSIEPLIETISQQAVEHVEVGLLRRAVEVLEAACTAAATSASPRPSTLQLPERLDVVIEEGQRALLGAVGHLSATTDALGATVLSSVDALKAVIGTMAAELLPLADRGNGASGFSELQGAIEALTAVLERLTTLPENVEEPSLGGDHAARPKVQEPRLARELRNLLQEIEAAR